MAIVGTIKQITLPDGKSYQIGALGNGGFYASIPTLTADSVIALTSDIPTNYVTTNTTQTISGAKTFTQDITIQKSSPQLTLYDNSVSSVRSTYYGLYDIEHRRVTRPSPGTPASVTTYTYTFPTQSGTIALAANIPTVNDAILTIQGAGVAAATFSANQSTDATLNIKGSGATTVSKTAAGEITISSTDNNDNQTVKVGTATFGVNAAVAFTGTNAVTVTANTADNLITIDVPVVTNTNQTVKVGSTTFTASAAIDLVAGSNVQITAATSGTGAPKITFSATDTTYSIATSISASSSNSEVAGAKAVYDAIEALPEPMIFKGSVGDSGTVTWTNLPAATSSEGWTYKVITAHATAPVCKVGDTIISNGTDWVVIPSGDEPSGTVTSVGLTMPTGFTVSSSPITSSGTIDVTFATGYSIPTDTKQAEWDAKPSTDTNYYHTAGSWSGYSYTLTGQGGASNITITLPVGTTSDTVAAGDHTHNNYVTLNSGQSISGQKIFAQPIVVGWVFGQTTYGNASIQYQPTGGTTSYTYSFPLASGTLALASQIPTDTGATSVTVSGSGNVVNSATYDAASRTITLTKGVTAITAHQGIKALNTDNTSSQTVSASEAIAGSGTINLHRIAKTGDYGDLLNTPWYLEEGSEESFAGTGYSARVDGRLQVYDDNDSPMRPTDVTGFNDADLSIYSCGFTVTDGGEPDGAICLSFPSHSGTIATEDQLGLTMLDLRAVGVPTGD